MKIKTVEDGNSWVVTAPPSKSFMNRALIIAALSKGVSRLKNPIYCDDTKYMIKALKAFGVKIETTKKEVKKYNHSTYIDRVYSYLCNSILFGYN